jgi:hypothetical protein
MAYVIRIKRIQSSYHWSCTLPSVMYAIVPSPVLHGETWSLGSKIQENIPHSSSVNRKYRHYALPKHCHPLNRLHGVINPKSTNISNFTKVKNPVSYLDTQFQKYDNIAQCVIHNTILIHKYIHFRRQT